RSPPSTRPSDARGRRSSACVREDSERASGSALLVNHRRFLETAKRAGQYAMPALIWRRVESTILTGMPADRLAGDAGPAQLTLPVGDRGTIRTCILRCRKSALIL